MNTAVTLGWNLEGEAPESDHHGKHLSEVNQKSLLFRTCGNLCRSDSEAAWRERLVQEWLLDCVSPFLGLLIDEEERIKSRNL